MESVAPPIRVSPPDVAKEFVRPFVDAVRLVVQQTNSDSRDLSAIEALRHRVLTRELPLTPALMAARVWYSVLCDLAGQGWRFELDEESVLIRPPAQGANAVAEKERVRSGHLIDRDWLLRQDSTRRFVAEMESTRLYRGGWHSIFSLMRDGRELSTRLAQITTLELPTEPLSKAIQPYLQFIQGEETCEFTGLRLLDIWKYFRLTWTTVPQSLPGRRMLVLVRDAAAENHPVIGIAALGSSVVQLGVRDKWIGWHPDVFLDRLAENPSTADARWVLNGVKDAIADLHVRDLIRRRVVTRETINKPTPAVIARLRRFGRQQRVIHERHAKSGGHKQASQKPHETDWRAQAQTYLFRSKRALALAAALEVRLSLSKLGFKRPSRKKLRAVLEASLGRKAVAAVLRYQKSKHVGIDMLDITVCGAVPPYTHLLGGKLVALLLTSTEVVRAYRRRYQAAPSIIASAMKGRVVTRRPSLVFLGTTSLYGVASSQYNRLVIPQKAFPEQLRGDIRYAELGLSVGFGSYHFTQRTVEEMGVLAQQRRGGRKVNYIFGEGTNPKLRMIREVVESIGFPADRLLRHGSSRLVYGVALASNFKDVLTGTGSRPLYLFEGMEPQAVTMAISNFWKRRWLANRILSSDVLTSVASHTTIRPVSHGARVRFLGDELGLPLFSAEPPAEVT